MNSLASGRFFKTVFPTEHTAQMKSLLASLRLHNACYVSNRPETDLSKSEKKNTLIAAFLANATSLSVHAPLKGGCIILRCSLRSVSIQFSEDHAKIFHHLKSDFILTCPIAMKLSPLTDFGLKFLKI